MRRHLHAGIAQQRRRVHWFRLDGPVGELYDVGVVPGVVRPMSLGFASNEIMSLITHDPLAQSLPT